MPGGRVAYGSWYGGKVRFRWDNPDYGYDYGGFREAIEVPLKPQPLIP